MKFGICAGFEYLETLKEAGSDFIEVSANEIASMTDAEIKEQMKRCEDTGLFAEVFKNLFPAHIKLTGDKMDFAMIDEYTRSVFDKASKLGIKTAVFGSGAARSFPEGADREGCMSQLVFASRLTAQNASEYGVTVAVEPLRSEETNAINTVSDAVQLCRAVNEKNFKINPDLYHMYCENEDFENLKKYSDFIAHVHVAEFKTRKLPSAGDGCDYKNVVRLLQNSGYNGRVSVEAHDEFTLQKYRGAMEAIRI